LEVRIQAAVEAAVNKRAREDQARLGEERQKEKRVREMSGRNWHTGVGMTLAGSCKIVQLSVSKW
jgi:hypothetical protein